MGASRQLTTSLYPSVFLIQCLLSNNIYDFGLIENDIKLNQLLLEDKVLTTLLIKIDEKDDEIGKIISSCSLSQNQGRMLHPIDAFCLIKKYYKNTPKIIESINSMNQTMLHNLSTSVLETLSEETYNKALAALGLLLKLCYFHIIYNK